MSTAILIGLTTVGLLAMWDSYLLTPTRKSVERWGLHTGVATLIYFLDCNACKAFWLCLVGAWIAGCLLLTIPAYGVAVVCLAVMGDGDE